MTWFILPMIALLILACASLYINDVRESLRSKPKR